METALFRITICFFLLFADQTVQLFLVNVMESVEQDCLAGKIRVVRTEYQNSFITQQEGIKIGNIDSCLAKNGNGIGSPPRFVVERERKYIGYVGGNAGFFQRLASFHWVGTDYSVDAVFHGVRNG